MTRILAGIGWVVFSMLLWAIPCNLLYFGIDYLDRHGIRIAPEVDFVLSLAPATGTVIILPLTAVLAIRGKLPWTAAPHSREQAPDFGQEP